jgi:hypothetical protein
MVHAVLLHVILVRGHVKMLQMDNDERHLRPWLHRPIARGQWTHGRCKKLRSGTRLQLKQSAFDQACATGS